MNTTPDVMTYAIQERAEFAEFLAGLTPEQWQRPTLCRVRTNGPAD